MTVTAEIINTGNWHHDMVHVEVMKLDGSWERMESLHPAEGYSPLLNKVIRLIGQHSHSEDDHYNGGVTITTAIDCEQCEAGADDGE